jgi:GGDEF domain-containing protein
MEKAVRSYKLDVGNGRFASVGVSLGAAAFPNSGETLDEILIAADKAMYAVKEQRKAFSQKKKQREIQSLTPIGGNNFRRTRYVERYCIRKKRIYKK